MKYPELRDELLTLLEQDQLEVRECSKYFKQSRGSAEAKKIRDEFILSSHKRIQRVFEILKIIGEPTVENIGIDGSQAISVLALHA